MERVVEEGLGLPRDALSFAAFPDGMDEVWSPREVAEVICARLREDVSSGRVRSGQTIVLLSFDARGVSGHPNHIATAAGVRLACVVAAAGMLHRVVGMELVSDGWPLPKFSGVCGAALFALGWWGQTNENAEFAVTGDLTTAAFALRLLWMHRSQMVWFRVLFIACARGTYLNKWRLVVG